MKLILNLYFNVIILYSLTYILKCRISFKYIILGSIIGAYRIFFNYYIFDIIMLLVVFRNVKSIIHYLFICLILKSINYNIIISPFLLFLYSFNYKKTVINKYYKTTIIYNNKKITLNGFMDTGNNLTYFNKPVILINKKYIKNMPNYFYIPYKTIDNESLLKAIKPNYIIINNKRIYNILVGTIEQDIDLILNPKILEEI